MSRSVKGLRFYSNFQANKLDCHRCVDTAEDMRHVGQKQRISLLTAGAVRSPSIGVFGASPLSPNSYELTPAQQWVVLQKSNPELNEPNGQYACLNFTPEGDVVLII